MRVVSRAYASSANFGPGFDVFAVALDAFYDEVCIYPGTSFLKIVGPYSSKIPGGVAKEFVKYMVNSFLDFFGLAPEPLGIYIYKGVPVGMGLGSSASSSVALIKALEVAYGVDAGVRELQYLASLGEEFVSGSRHIDNVSACINGGFVISSLEMGGVVIEPPPWLSIILLVPRRCPVYKEGKTRFARSLLRECYGLDEFVYNLRRASFLLMGLVRGDPDFIRYGLSDRLVEPFRRSMIPFPDSAINKFKEVEGVLGSYISGAGPTLALVVDTRVDGVIDNIKKVVWRYALDCDVVVSGIGRGVYSWVEK